MKLIICFLFILLLVSCSPAVPASTPSAVPTNTPIPTATETQVPIMPTASLTNTPPPSPSGKLVFTYFRGLDLDDPYWKPGYRDKFPDLAGDTNIFMSNWDGTDLVPLTIDGLDGYSYVQDVSSDNQKILIASFASIHSSFGNLYVVNINDRQPHKIASHVTPPGGGVDFSGIAKWINDTEIIYTGLSGGKNGIFRINQDGTGVTPITTEAKPYKIFAIDAQNGIYWRAMISSCCWQDYLRWTSIDSTQGKIIGKDVLAGPISMSANGKIVSWSALGSIYVSSNADFSNVRSISPPRPGGYLIFISPDASLIIFSEYVIYSRDQYKEPNSHFFAFLVFPPNYALNELAFPIVNPDERFEVIQDIAWSPDMRYALLNDSLSNSERAVSSPTRILDLQTLNFVTDISNNAQGKKSNFFWLPDRK